MNFCTLQNVEDFLQTSITGADKIASANRAIVEATAAIKNWCHQVIERVANDVVTLDVAGCGYRLFLPELPVVSVGAVVEDGVALAVTDDYKLGQYGVLHRANDVWWAQGIQIVQVTYTHGYSVIPDDVAAVCARAAARAYQAGLAAAAVGAVSGVSAMTLGDYSVTLGTGAGGGAGEGIMGASAARMLLLSEKDILSRYRYVAQ